MSKFLRYSLLIFSVGLPLSLVTVSEAKAQVLREIMRRMDEHNKSIQSLQADVIWVKTDPNLGAGGIDTSLGNITYMPKTGKSIMRARLNWTSPLEEWVVVEGNAFKSFRPKINQGYEGKADKSSKNNRTGGALSFITMSREQLRANYDVAYLGQEQIKGGVETWHLQLTPKTPQSYKVAEMWVDSDGMPRQIKVTEKNNDTNAFLLTKIKKNERVDASIFKLKIPKGAVMQKV